MQRWTRMIVVAAVLGTTLLRSAQAYIEIPYTLGRIITEANFILVMQVEKVEKERNLIIYRKVQDLKGTYPAEVIKHNIGKNGFHPREWQTTMEWAEPGKVAIFFHNGGASETCIDGYWYQAYAGGEWWNMSHGEPYLLRSYAGKPEKLVPAVQTILGGAECVVPCMVDGDKNTLQLRTARIQRLKASLKIQDYNAQRDFAGWGGEDLRRLTNMPGFTHIGSLSRVDPEALGIAPVDFDGDGKLDFLLYGSSRLALFQNAGSSYNETPLPLAGGARGAAWADFNGDGLPDLLLATPSGPKLLVNQGKGKFRDESACLPLEPYYHCTACAWIDYDGDGKPDILLADGYLGLRLYRNIASADLVVANRPPKLGPWKYIGPFENNNNVGFNAKYPPEQEIDFAKKYAGKNGEQAEWKDGNFNDGQVNNLRLFRDPNNDNASVYVYREIETSAPCELPVSLGSDDSLKVFLNGEQIHAEDVQRGAAPDQAKLTLKLKAGKNQFLMKIGQGNGDWAFYFQAGEPSRPIVPLFVDVSAKMGLGPKGIGAGQKGDHLAVADINNDGRPDFVYAAGPGIVALNTPQGFIDTMDTGLKFATGKKTPVFGPFTGGQGPDLIVPQTDGVTLFKNDGTGKFTDVTAESGDLRQTLNGAACVFAVQSPQGKSDLFVGCLGGPNHLLRNNGQGVFTNVSDSLGLRQKVFNTRAAAVLDLKGNGSLNIVMNNEGQESAVLLGKAPEKTPAPK